MILLNSLKNFLKCLAYVLIPLGCLFLGLLFGADSAFTILSEQITYIKTEVARIIPETAKDLDELWGYVIASARELSWKSPIEAIQTLLNGQWLTEKISVFLGLTTEEATKLFTELETILTTVIANLNLAVVIFFVWIILSGIAGYFIANLFVRRATVRRGIWKFIVVSLLDSFFSATIIALSTYILSLWSPGVLISATLSMAVFGFVSLLEAYLIHGRGKIPFVRVVNIQNCLLMYLSQIVILILATLLALLLLFATNLLVGLAVGYSVIIIAFLVVNVNAESYIVEQIKKLPAPLPESPPQKIEE